MFAYVTLLANDIQILPISHVVARFLLETVFKTAFFSVLCSFVWFRFLFCVVLFL